MIQPSRFVVPDALADTRVDLFLARQDPEHSRSLYQRAIAEGRVRLNGHRVKKWERVAAGDTVDVEPFEPACAGPLPDPSVPLVVVHEDEALLVVDKPAGVPVHPHGPEETGTLAGALVARYPELVGVGPQPLEPGLVHRLDTQTSGLLVVARTPAAFRALASAFAERRVEKVYIALVLGSPPAIGSITTPIGHHPTDKRKMIVEGDPAGPPRSPRPAVTHFAVRRRYAGYTELEVRIDTGRMHQIRAHLASIGHPLAGDALYQKPAEFARDRLGLARPFLHAARLAFDHPVNGRQVELPGEVLADTPGDSLSRRVELPPEVLAGSGGDSPSRRVELPPEVLAGSGGDSPSRRVEFSAPLPPDLVTALARLPEVDSAAPQAAEATPQPAKRPKRARKVAAPAPRRTFIRRPGAGKREVPAPPAEGAGSSSRLGLDAPEVKTAPSREDARPAGRFVERSGSWRSARSGRQAGDRSGVKTPRVPKPRARREAERAAARERPAGLPKPGEFFGVDPERPRRGDRQARDARRAGALKPARRPPGPAGRSERDGQRATERAPRGEPPAGGRSRPARPGHPPARRPGFQRTPPEDQRSTPRPRRADDRRSEGPAPAGGGPARRRPPGPSRFRREERPPRPRSGDDERREERGSRGGGAAKPPAWRPGRPGGGAAKSPAWRPGRPGGGAAKPPAWRPGRPGGGAAKPPAWRPGRPGGERPGRPPHGGPPGKPAASRGRLSPPGSKDRRPGRPGPGGNRPGSSPRGRPKR
jgi:23S rRNA pseudouridine1911/1915/1917 synthase